MVVAFILFWIFAWIFLLRTASFEEKIWVTLLFIFCAFPSVLYIAGQKFRVPLMPMWGIGYFAMFGMPMLSMDPSSDLAAHAQSAVVSALQVVTLGAAGCLLAVYSPAGAWVEPLVPRWKLPWDPAHASRIGVLLILAGLTADYFQMLAKPILSVGQFLFIASQLATVGALTLFLLQLRKRLSLAMKVFLWGFTVPVQILLALSTGAVWEVVRTTTPFLFCYSAERRRIPWKWLLILTVCLIPFLGTKQEYRSYAWYSEESPDINVPNNAIGLGLSYIQLTFRRLMEGGMETYTVAAETSEARINHLELFTTLKEMTPSPIPFLKGETYATIWWALVPRLIYPDKPTKTVGNEFGRHFGLLHESDDTTSYNLPHQVVEMYINFGVPGVLIGMVTIGLLYRIVLAFLSHPDSGERGLLIGCALLANLLSLDSDFSLVFGGVIYYVLLMVLFTRFLRPPIETAAA